MRRLEPNRPVQWDVPAGRLALASLRPFTASIANSAKADSDSWSGTWIWFEGANVQPEALSKLPLEKRYVWRVASAMKWGFADFDSEPVAADRDTQTPKIFAKAVDLLKFRPIQFCMFLKALVGAEEMERLMNHAVTAAKPEG